jgi:hypothetical protein
MYKINTNGLDQYQILVCQTKKSSIPLDPENRHYQECLDAIIEDGADCFEGDIPADLQAAADAKLFAQQVADYTQAKARLAQYIVSVGREEVVESVPTGEQVWDYEAVALVDVMVDVVTVTAIEPVEATVEVLSYDDESGEETTSTIENPLITTDVAERADAQAVVDATPQPVKDHVNGD